MINYAEKGHGVHKRLEAAGVVMSRNVDTGEWVSNNDGLAQSIMDGYTLADAQEDICLQIDAHASELRNKVVSGISPGEMSSWPIKRSEAIKYQSSLNANDAPMLSVEAAARGVTLNNIVSRVIVNADGLSNLEANIAGVAGRHKDAIKASADFSAVTSYNWLVGWPSV